MDREEMKRRMRAYALRVANLASSFPRTRLGNVVGYQLMKSGTSVGANYRAACRARSKAEFVAKIGIVEEEADETLFWIDFAAEAGLVRRSLVADLANEGEQILSMMVKSRKTAVQNRQSTIGNRQLAAVRT